MKNLKVFMKLIIGFLIVVILTIIVGGTGIYGLISMGNAANTMYSQKAIPLGDLEPVLNNVSELCDSVR